MAELEYRPGEIGIDEAGRGPLAGPVVVAAVVLPEGAHIAGLNDSKKLNREQLENIEVQVRKIACFHIELSEPAEIDEKNILWATMAAMERAACALAAEATVWVDGNRVPEKLFGRGRAVVKGDGKIAEIAAASVLAKTYRDRLMVEYGAQYPGYGFESHFGYPTPEHFAALERFGPCPIHRRSFAPVARLLSVGQGEPQLSLFAE